MKEIAVTAAKCAAINFGIGFVLVAGMINRAVGKTVAGIIKDGGDENE